MKISLKYIIIIFILCLFAGCATEGTLLKLEPSLQKDIRSFDGTPYVPLVLLCDIYGLKWNWDPYVKVVTIEKQGVIVLRVDSDSILSKGMQKRLDRPVLLKDGAVFVPVSFVKNELGAIVEVRPVPVSKVAEIRAAPSEKKSTIRTVVIDAGHGGKDAGAVGRKLRLKERDINLTIARKLRNILEANGIRVVMTRDSDTFISLPKRVQIANSSGADLFVSIHVNASRSRSLLGFECYYLSEAMDDNARAVAARENASLKLGEDARIENSDGLSATLWDITLTENRRESIELARNICKSVDTSLAMKNRGIRSARFYVLKGVRMPAVLAEHGYISNRYEELKLSGSKYLDRLAGAVADGILAYKREYENTEGFTR